MVRLENQEFVVTCQADGTGLELIDRKRRTRWALDYRTLVYGRDARAALDGANPVGPEQMVPLRAESEDDWLSVALRAGPLELALRFQIRDGFIEARLPALSTKEIGFAALPGSFAPQGEPLRLLLPVMQGMLWDGRGPAFNALRGEAHHLGFSMPWLGYLGTSGGLLVTAETADDAQWWFGKDPAGRTWASGLQIASLGALRYERAARIYATEPDIVAIAKQYRRKVIEQGRFKSWEEKVAERPYLERLFGALMAFIGYCQDDLDYAAEARKLKAYGFDRALLYPGRFNMYYQDIHMGGLPPIDLPPATTRAILEMGYDLAPWSWLNEGLDDGSQRMRRMFRRDPAGEITPHWSIDDQQWYQVCYSFLVDNQKGPLEGEIASMTWDHFDVLACVPGIECYVTDHPNHLGRPMTRTESKEWVRKVFRLDQQYNRIVSSENFNDSFSLEYDLGSVKAWPQYGPWPFWPVPLTMLVYHDSLIHSWWEVHSYNNGWRGRTRGPQMFEYGGGRPRLMAAADALMGCPPDVFPFGAQYGYSGCGKETFLYRYRFEDPEVQIALREALPVARLHRRIGRQELVHFKFLSEDGYLQETAFADGTRIVANFSRDFAGSVAGVDHVVAHGVDRLAPESWQEAK
jgi:hypothetical protein